MQRVTITIDDELAAAVDRLVDARGYPSRSEAIRDLARSGLHESSKERGANGNCVAALFYVYEHESRDLAQRLTQILHDHHDLAVSSLHVHLDHDSCMEVTILRGQVGRVHDVGDRIIAERGVHYGRLVTAPVRIESETHSHGAPPHRHQHTHLRKGA